MSRLSPRTQALIRDVKITGLSTREAAEKHGMTESAVKVAVHRGLKALGEEHGGGGDED
jgi:RNA polymerase sigma-70 factor (ECF subfamily)